MSMMAQVQRGRTSKPPRVLVYGTEGIGKSTFASESPKPVFIQTEDGLDEISCDKFPLATTYDDVLAALAELRSEQHDYETAVIDSLDWLERLVWDKLCTQYGVNSIEKVDGGYARGYTHALTFWREIIDHLNALRNTRGMVVLMIAHSKVERFENPETSPTTAFRRVCTTRRGAAQPMVRRRAVRDAEDSHPDRRRRLRPANANDCARDRQGRRRPRPALHRRTKLRRQEPLRNHRGTAALLGGVHERTIYPPNPRSMNNMADLRGFDANSVEPTSDFEPIPAGKYPAVIAESEMKPNKAGTGHFLQLTFQVIDGPYKNRFLWWGRVPGQPECDCRADRSRGALRNLSGRRRAGPERFGGPAQPAACDPCEVRQRADTGELTNEIKGYGKKDSSPPPAAAAPRPAARRPGDAANA